MNESQEHILKTSLDLFLHSGYANVSMKDILDKAGFSRGAFYHYFESKETCFKECVQYYLSRVTHPEPADYTGVSLKIFLEDNLRRMAETANEINVWDRFRFFNEASKIISDFAAYMGQRNARELAVWTRVIENAVNAGEITERIPAGEAASLFIAQCDGILVTLGMSANADGRAVVARQWDNLYTLLKE